MLRLNVCRVVFDTRRRLLKVHQFSVQSPRSQQSARCLSITAFRQNVDPESLKFEAIETISSSALSEPTLYSQGLGLANHWPSGWMQALLEQVHLLTDLPWWGTIVTTTLAVRIVISPLAVIARRHAVRNGNFSEELSKYQDEVMTSYDDPKEAARWNEEYKQFKKDNNINELMPIVPIFGTAAVFSSTFFALRGMANLPVESLKTGGTLWFQNLAAADPFYLLPLLTSASLFINTKIGGDGADTLPPFFEKSSSLYTYYFITCDVSISPCP